jgi:starch-binding outer membrane protein, SusD/RagB family
MNKYIYLIALILFTCYGCDNLLETKDLLNKNEQNYPATEEDVQSSLAGIYQQMAFVQYGEIYVGTMVSDETFGGGGPDDAVTTAIDQLKKSNENMLTLTWSPYYAGIFRANKLMENIDNVKKLSASTKKLALGESYFMRAWFHFNLAQLFGNVPVYTTSESVIRPNSTPEELYGQIASDLKTAIDSFPATNYTAMPTTRLGHANRWAAEGLLARVYLFYTGYYQKTELPLAGGGVITKAQVITYLEECINNSGHALATDFRTLWPYTNKYTVEDYPYTAGKGLKWLGEEGLNKETVFAIKFGNIADYNDFPSGMNKINTGFSLRGQSLARNTFPFGAGWGHGTVNTRMIDQWKTDEPNDPRITMSILNLKDPAEGIVKYEENGMGQMHDTHYFIKKYTTIMAWKNKATKTVYGSYTNILYGSGESTYIRESQDLVLLRFSDLLLMHSELTETNTGLNRVRARVGLPAIAYSFDALQKERFHELAFEGIRYYDLLRWYRKDAGAILQANQQGVAVLNSNVPATMNFQIQTRMNETGGFWPIPTSEISLSKGILVQNPGWGSEGSL